MTTFGRLLTGCAIIVLPMTLMAALVSCDSEPRAPAETAYSGKPPKQYQGDLTVTVHFVKDVAKACSEAGLKHMAGTVVEECTIIGQGRQEIILPNACLHGGSYAVATCHGIGHINGWPPHHPLK